MLPFETKDGVVLFPAPQAL